MPRRGMASGRRQAAIESLAVAGLLAALLFVPDAGAELSQSGGLFARFGGALSPRILPRDSRAPVSVRIEGAIRAPDDREPPALRRIEVALNRGGVLDARGLPACHRTEIASATPRTALARCGHALVGSGGITARTAFPGQPGYLLRGEVLLFNTVADGHPAILAHVFQREPTPVVRFILFHVHRTSGTFGTVLDARLSPSFNRNGYLTSLFMQLGRTFVSDGRHRAYISAGCPTPPGIPIASFPFARVAMGFAGGRTLSATLIRACKVSR